MFSYVLSGLGCVVSRELAAPRFGILWLLGVPFSGMCFVWLGCDGADDLPGGMACLGARGLSSPLLLSRLCLPAVKLMCSMYCGCVWLQRCLSDGVVPVVLVFERGRGSWVRWMCFSGPVCRCFEYSNLPVGREPCCCVVFVLC